MVWNRLDLLRFVAPVMVAAVACAAVPGCSPLVTWRASSRPLVAPPGRALVVAVSDPASTYHATVRILDENAEVVADVPDGEHAVFETAPGEHVFAAFAGMMPNNVGAVGALHATLAPGRIYAFVVATDVETPPLGLFTRREVRLLVELTAVHGADLRSVLSGLPPEDRRELLPKDQRPTTPGEDIDIREAVMGLAKLRVGGDDPNRALPGILRSIVPPSPPWLAARSTLTVDDGASL